MPAQPAGPSARQAGHPSAAELFSQLFPDGVQLTGELFADLEQWVRLTSKLAAGGNGTTRYDSGQARQQRSSLEPRQE